MEDKRCENCYNYFDGYCQMPSLAACIDYDQWEPNERISKLTIIEDSQSQLDKAHKIIKQDTAEIAEILTEIGEFRKIIQEFVLWGPMTKSDRDYFDAEFKRLLTYSAPVDEEKEIKICPIYGRVIDCGNCNLCDTKARFRIEEGEKK